MTNSTVPDKYKNLQKAPVYIKRHVLIGSNCTVLPGVTINEGTAVGSMSLVKESLESFNIYAGIPCKKIKKRERGFLDLEKKLLSENEF